MLGTAAFAACALILLVAPVRVAAQPVITSPRGGAVFVAGPDYATDVLQDPWDFDNVEDVSPFPDDNLNWDKSEAFRFQGASALGAGTGRLSFESTTTDPAIGLVYAGIAGIVNPGRTGLRYPIETSRYQKLAVRMTSDADASRAVVYWFGGPKPSPQFPDAPGIGGAMAPAATASGDHIYQIDLVGDRLSSTPLPFTSQRFIPGLRFDPFGTANVRVEIDWVRLTAPDSSPLAAMMDVEASNCTTGSVSLAVIDGGVATVVDTSLPLRFNYGIFPPGTYNLELTCGGVASSMIPFTIAPPPLVTVTTPGTNGPDDYAATELGNPWDMHTPKDWPRVANLDIAHAVQTPGQPTGVMMFEGRNAKSSKDPAVYLLFGEGDKRPIASRHYRYLTFTAELDSRFELSSANGSMARVFWASTPLFDGNVATQTSDIVMYPGRHTYTIDLAALTVGDGLDPINNVAGTSTCGPERTCSWAAESPRYLRIDPHEFSTKQVMFHLDDVTLRAPSEVVQGGTTPIRWHARNAGTETVKIYLDTDRDPVNGRTLVASSVSLAAGQYAWPAGVTPPGDYYVAVAIDGPTGPVRESYSTGVLRVIPAVHDAVVTISAPAAGQTAHVPFDITGCSYDRATGVSTGEVIVYAHPLEGQGGGTTRVLGYNPAGGSGQLSASPCNSGPGYRVSNITLPAGRWRFRTLARNERTGNFDEVNVQNVLVTPLPPPARNLRVEFITGNTVTVRWDPPAIDYPLVQYRIEAAGEPSFSGFTPLVFPPNVLSAGGTLPDGTYYVRVRTGNRYTGEGPVSNVIAFTLPGGTVPGPPAPPGPPTLVGTQVTANPITLSWSPGLGGAPAEYYVFAGTAPRSSNLGTFPMGAATAVQAVAPSGPVYVRVLAINAGGQAFSNEISFQVSAPAPPVLQTPVVRGVDVWLAWTPSTGAESYVVIARDATGRSVLTTLPVAGPALFVPSAPSGTYQVTVVAVNGSGWSAESNAFLVAVPR